MFKKLSFLLLMFISGCSGCEDQTMTCEKACQAICNMKPHEYSYEGDVDECKQVCEYDRCSYHSQYEMNNVGDYEMEHDGSVNNG